MTEIYKLARPKLRGVPCAIASGQVKCDGFENRMVMDILGGLPQFVGEIVVGSPTAEDCYERTKRFLEQQFEINLFVFWVYDLKTTENYDLRTRLEIVEPFVAASGVNIQYVDHELITSPEELEAYKTKIFERDFTGVVLREPYGTFGTYDEEILKETTPA